MREIYLITLSGQDRPGVTASLTETLARYGATILDVGQAVIHELLTLGMLIEVPAEAQSGPILKDLLFKAHELDLRIRFSPITAEQYAHWVNQQGKPRYIITILGRRILAGHIAAIASVLAQNGLNIDVINRLSGRVPLAEHRITSTSYACIEMSVRGRPQDPQGIRARFFELAQQTGIDIAFQEDDLYRRNRRLIALDMDSTLIRQEVIDLMAEAAGVGPQVRELTERAMRGEMDFRTALQRRLRLLRGVTVQQLEEVAQRLELTEGAERFLRVLKQIGYRTALISGGFTYFAQYLQKKLGVDYVFANELEIRDGKLTGEIVGEIMDAEQKASVLRQLAAKEGINLKQVIAVGDGANDLLMLQEAGLGIAFRAKPIVKQSAQHALSIVGLDAILYLMGIRDREVQAALQPQESALPTPA